MASGREKVKMNRRNFFKAVAYGVGAMAVPVNPIEGHAVLIEDDLSRFEWSAWAEHADTVTPSEFFYLNDSNRDIDNPQGCI